ncbi:hypothetical protein [Acinetobacter sp. ANC 3813]|uniref:hypothetical protein n=1 Tax=Acinetobacter sp. ANC 3813 TaxID=1977873 RepID=UPI000A3404AF|nr:hypothetical protein [Acinetobacter sp. ANC 3813]OTG91604.1 hypothetical protein B9T34_04680 [Acinetobacter sp. ANC 3813]
MAIALLALVILGFSADSVMHIKKEPDQASIVIQEQSQSKTAADNKIPSSDIKTDVAPTQNIK